MGKKKLAAAKKPAAVLAFGLVLDDDTDGGIEVARFATRPAVVAAASRRAPDARWFGVRDVATGAVEWIDRHA